MENETGELPSGAMLLLYTDGLIERRHVDLAASVERLKRAFSEAPGDVAEVLDWVEAKLEIQGVGDDVALLGMAVGAAGPGD